MEKMRKIILGTIMVSIFVIFSSLSANAGICFTLDSGDFFKGEYTVKGSYLTLAMVETNYSRATFGSAWVGGSTVYIGLTKNTADATVQYQCSASLSNYKGTCNIVVLWFDGLVQAPITNITITTCTAADTADSISYSGLPVLGEK